MNTKVLFILALGAPIVTGLPGGRTEASINRQIFNSSISIPPFTIGVVNNTQTTSTAGVAPQVTAPPQAIVEGGNFVFTLINFHTAPVVTIHAHGAGQLGAVGKDDQPHTMSQGQTDTFAVPTGWSGRVAMFEDGYNRIIDRATLLEGSFMTNQGSAHLAVVCECNGAVFLGCNLDMNGNCPVCYHHRPQDDLATIYDIPGCSRSTTCCIGTACKPHPGQMLCPAENGQTRSCVMGDFR